MSQKPENHTDAFWTNLEQQLAGLMQQYGHAEVKRVVDKLHLRHMAENRKKEKTKTIFKQEKL